MELLNKKTKILIRGYYGFGNLGDDVLMIASYRFVKQNFPYSLIYVFSESKNHSYIGNLLGSEVQLCNSASKIHFDLTIHGGGGVFFDFKDKNTQYLLLNKLIKAVGYRRFRKLLSFYKILKGSNGLSTNRRVGIGIGIGTFAASSQKFYNSITVLSDFDFLWVRDKESFDNLQIYKFEYPVELSTDLAFATDLWMPSSLKRQFKNNPKKIGVVLRDWEYGFKNHIQIVKSTMDLLKHEGYEINYFSFDKNADKDYISHIEESEDCMFAWNPDIFRFHDYLQLLQSQDLVVSSRAHGAIIAACLGIPSLCLAIEPKLSNVAQMLEQSSLLINMPFSSAQLLESIKTMISTYDLLESAIKKDFDVNSFYATNSLEKTKK